MDLVQTCVGGSAQVPCPLPNVGRGAVEGVILKRRKGDAAAEVLYDSKRNHGSSASSSTQFPPERIRLSSAPGPAGITYNLSLQQLQLQDSGLYSCQLLQRDGAGGGGGGGLGRSAIFVSVEGGEMDSLKKWKCLSDQNIHLPQLLVQSPSRSRRSAAGRCY